MAFPLFSSTGLQLAELLVIGLAIRYAARARWRGFIAYYVLVTPVWLSAGVALLTDTAADGPLAIKNALVISVVLLVLPAAAALSARTLPSILWALVAVSLLHLAIAGWQMVEFKAGRFPGLALYDSNPSFAPYRGIAQEYARFVHRPFGWLPEPSAMAASLGPWAVVAVLIGIRDPRRNRLWVALAGAATIVTLVVMSGSGYLVFLVVSLGLLALGFSRATGPAIARRRRLGLTLLAGNAAAALFGLLLLSNRVQQSTTSYQSRWASIRTGLNTMLEQSPVFGLGPGQSSSKVTESGVAIVDRFGAHIPTSIASVLLRYIAETGLVGVLALLLIFVIMGRSVARSAEPLAGLAVALACTAAITFTTSYLELLSPWLLVGMLLHWDRLFPRDDESCTLSPVSRSVVLKKSSPVSPAPPGTRASSSA